MAYARLFLVIFVVNSILLWFVGDFNLYLGEGAAREFKSFPSPLEKAVGTFVGGFASAAVCAISFGLVELICFSIRSRRENQRGQENQRGGKSKGRKIKGGKIKGDIVDFEPTP